MKFFDFLYIKLILIAKFGTFLLYKNLDLLKSYFVHENWLIKSKICILNESIFKGSLLPLNNFFMEVDKSYLWENQTESFSFLYLIHEIPIKEINSCLMELFMYCWKKTHMWMLVTLRILCVFKGVVCLFCHPIVPTWLPQRPKL